MKIIESSDLEKYHDTLFNLVSNWYDDENRRLKFKHLNTERIQLIMMKMASYGWYFDDFSKGAKINHSQCLKFIYNNFPEKLDSYLSKYYNERILEIKNNLISKYPKRKAIILEAFFAHENKMYHSSICLFITIIDGVCDDNLDVKFFKNKKNLPEIKEKLEKKNLKYSDFLLTPIRNKGAINSWEKELDKHPIRLNRHEIIHGKDINYGIEINSLKVISMVSYLDYVLNHYN